MTSYQEVILSTNFPYYMQPEDSSPHSQVPDTCPYLEPDQTSPYVHPTYRSSTLILRFHLRVGLPSCLFPSGHHPPPTKILYAPLLSPTRSTCPAHLILLDFITRIIFGDEDRLSLPNFMKILHCFKIRKFGITHRQEHRTDIQFCSR